MLKGVCQSTNRTLLTPESLNGIRQVKDAVAAEDGKIHAMDFNKEFISCIRRAHEKYRQRLKERRKQEEAEKNAKARKETEAQKQLAEEKAFQEKNRKFKQTEKDLQKAAEVLLSEANQRLADAVKSKDFNEVTVS